MEFLLGKGDYRRCIRDTAQKAKDDPLLRGLRPSLRLLRLIREETQMKHSSDVDGVDLWLLMRDSIGAVRVEYTLHARFFPNKTDNECYQVD